METGKIPRCMSLTQRYQEFPTPSTVAATTEPFLLRKWRTWSRCTTNSFLPIIVPTTYHPSRLPDPLHTLLRQLHPPHQLQVQNRVSESRASVQHPDVMDPDIEFRVSGLKDIKQKQDAHDAKFVSLLCTLHSLILSFSLSLCLKHSSHSLSLSLSHTHTHTHTHTLA